MAKAKANGNPQTASADNKLTWVTIELDSADEQALAALNWSADEVLDNLAELVSAGYGVSVKHDGYSGSVACHIVCNTPTHHDYGFGVTGYGSYLTDAIVVALFKLDAKAKGSLSTYKAAARRFR